MARHFSPSLIITALLILVVASSFVSISTALPFVVFHGLGDQCISPEMIKLTHKLSKWSSYKGYCIEVGDGLWDSWFRPLEVQVAEVCEKIKKMVELKAGYNIVGLSQGNLIARGVIQYCDGAPPVKTFISLGGPHAGTASVPGCTGIFCIVADNLIKSEVYSDYVQTHLAPSGYVKLPNDIPSYLKKCRFLPKLNNELPHARNVTYKQRFSSLESLVLIMFEDDAVLIPKETAWFGYYPNGAFTPVLSPRKTELYTQDWIGLKTLDKAGKVKFLKIDDDHLSLDNRNMKKYIVPYLSGSGSSSRVDYEEDSSSSPDDDDEDF
ncbi:palmitoyl-protein thioesterase 1-like [Impatiens glandulifera]|uniref:palmitoyl-protein thioesterase 1-like n=1 Tax=Impatiens glandulifera TaxID=253017 RepID=UPI001FB180D5|nr:palmitoyl-protein thioesterase 1-like [Impatiens glandulifera]